MAHNNNNNNNNNKYLFTHKCIIFKNAIIECHYIYETLYVKSYRRDDLKNP